MTTVPPSRGRRRVRRVPAGRYASASPGSRRRTAAAVAALAALLLAVLVVVAVHNSAPTVSYGLLGYRPVSDRGVLIRFEVTKAADVAAVCVLRARDADGVETGRARVPVPARAGGARRTERSYLLATRARAITGEVQSCTRAPAGT